MDNCIKVIPIIDTPACLKAGRTQDCFHCVLFNEGKCDSPRSACAQHYKSHKKGCPNFGVRADCPPLAPMFDQVFDTKKDIYAVYSVFDLNAHVQKMQSKHPQWSQKQLYNLLYWQGTAKKQLKENLKCFMDQFREQGYYATACPEAMGVKVTETLSNAGIKLEWPVKNTVYKVALAGVLLEERYKSILL